MNAGACWSISERAARGREEERARQMEERVAEGVINLQMSASFPDQLFSRPFPASAIFLWTTAHHSTPAAMALGARSLARGGKLQRVTTREQQIFIRLLSASVAATPGFSIERHGNISQGNSHTCELRDQRREKGPRQRLDSIEKQLTE